MTAKKTPQDRKPKAEPIVRPEDTKGFNLLRPIDELPVWDQAPLLSLIYKLRTETKIGVGEETITEVEVELDPAVIGPIAQAMVAMARDKDEFTKFCTGRKAMMDVAQLAMAWANALGEDESSDGN